MYYLSLLFMFYLLVPFSIMQNEIFYIDWLFLIYLQSYH